MKKIFYTAIGFFLFTAIVGYASKAQSMAISEVHPSPLATQRNATRTPMPTATIDYQKTAVVLQATADEARRLNAQATIELYKVQQAQINATAQVEQMQFQKLSWTATAANTSIPLTSTAQVVNNTAIASYQKMQAAQMTATYQAPQILRDMKDAQMYNAALSYYVEVWIKGMAGIFFIAVPVLLFVLRKTESIPLPIEDEKPPSILRELKPIVEETVIRVQQTGAFPRMDRMVVPCSAEQWDEFVRGVILENKSLAFGNWEGADSPFTRDEYTALRNFMQANQLAQSAGQGSLILSARGEEIFRAWIEQGELPKEYHFSDMEKLENA